MTDLMWIALAGGAVLAVLLLWAYALHVQERSYERRAAATDAQWRTEARRRGIPDSVIASWPENQL